MTVSFDDTAPEDGATINNNMFAPGDMSGLRGPRRHPDLLEMDEDGKFFIREYGGQPRVAWFGPRGGLVTMSPRNFATAYIDKMTEVGVDAKGNPVRRKTADLWLADETTRRYKRVEFAPGRELPEDVLNLWQGWPYRPGWDDYGLTLEGRQPVVNGPLDREEMPSGHCDLFMEHLHEHMCGGDDDLLYYLLAWMADALWNPGPCETVVVLRGPEGSGKTLWAEEFAKFFGPHAVTLDDIKQLIGDFNQHLLDKSFVFADEAFFAGNRAHAAKLRTVASRPDQLIEPKGVNSFLAPKHWRLAMASNDEHVIRASATERRSFVLEVDAGSRNQDREWFGALRRELDAGGREALFRWLTGRWWGEQVGGGRFREWERPITGALEAQKDLSLQGPALLIHNMLSAGEPPGEHLVRGDSVFVATRLLIDAGRLGMEHERSLGDALGALARATSIRQYLGAGHSRRQYRGFWLPSLGECRRRWEGVLGRSVEWPKGPTAWSTPGEAGSEPPF